MDTKLYQMLSTIGVIDDGKGFNVEECSQKCLGLSIVNSYVEDKLKESIQLESTA